MSMFYFFIFAFTFTILFLLFVFFFFLIIAFPPRHFRKHAVSESDGLASDTTKDTTATPTEDEAAQLSPFPTEPSSSTSSTRLTDGMQN